MTNLEKYKGTSVQAVPFQNPRHVGDKSGRSYRMPSMITKCTIHSEKQSYYNNMETSLRTKIFVGVLTWSLVATCASATCGGEMPDQGLLTYDGHCGREKGVDPRFCVEDRAKKFLPS